MTLANIGIKFKSPLDLKLYDIPTQYDVGLNDIIIREIPTIKVDIPTKYDVGLNDIRIKELPDIRAHLPVNMNFGFKIFGFEVASLSMCGESQLITEKYVPNARERCEKDPCDEC